MFYEVARDGDIILILNGAKLEIDAWDDNAEPANAVCPPSERRPRADVNDTDDSDSETSTVIGNDSDDGVSSFNGFTPAPSTRNQSETSSTTNSVPSMKLRVSSRHLSLASTRLSRMLDSYSFKTFSKGGVFDVKYKCIGIARGWDPDVLVVFMKIIHGRTRFVPRQVTLEFLTKISQMVDYFGCHEHFEVWFEGFWRPNLIEPLPHKYNRDLVLRLFVACVFKEVAIYNILTHIAIIETRGPMQTLGLPFDERLVATLDETRQSELEKIFADIREIMDTLHNDESCSNDCSDALLGNMYKNLRANGLDPWPKAPLVGYSISDVISGLESFRVPKLPGRPRMRESLLQRFTCCCGANKQYLEPAIREWRASVQAIQLGTCSNTMYEVLSADYVDEDDREGYFTKQAGFDEDNGYISQCISPVLSDM